MPILRQNRKISEFDILNNPTGDVVVPVVVNGDNYKVSLDALSEYVESTLLNKHWEGNVSKTLGSTETLVLSGNYVLSNTNLTIDSDNVNIQISGIDFNKYGQIFIGGYLLLINSNINNNGLISAAGGIIMSGNSTITGTGIII